MIFDEPSTSFASSRLGRILTRKARTSRVTGMLSDDGPAFNASGVDENQAMRRQSRTVDLTGTTPAYEARWNQSEWGGG